MKKYVLVLLVVLALSTGCYWKKEVEEYEVGLVSNDGVKIDYAVSAGRYTDWSWYAQLHKMDTSAKSIDWSDPDLVTRDKQPIGLSLSVTYRRPPASDMAVTMFNVYRAESKHDDALGQFVLNRIPRAAKAVTAKYTLDQMLGISKDAGREAVARELNALLQEELDEAGIALLDLGINNISVDPDYLNRLKAKANSQAQLELAQQKTLELDEQLKQEMSQTEIDLEVARRQNAVAEEKAKVFEASDRAYELRKLELLQGVVGDTDKIYFVPEGMDLTLILGGGVVPLD